MYKKSIIMGFVFIFIFILWTLALTCVNVRAIGPNGTSVAMATLNMAFHNFTGVHWGAVCNYRLACLGTCDYLPCLCPFGTVPVAQKKKYKKSRCRYFITGPLLYCDDCCLSSIRECSNQLSACADQRIP